MGTYALSTRDQVIAAAHSSRLTASRSPPRGVQARTSLTPVQTAKPAMTTIPTEVLPPGSVRKNALRSTYFQSLKSPVAALVLRAHANSVSTKRHHTSQPRMNDDARTRAAAPHVN